MAYLSGAVRATALAHVPLDTEPLDEEIRNGLAGSVSGTERELTALGLTASVATARRMRQLLDNPSSTWGQLRDLVDELRGRVEDEMQEALFLFVEETKATLFNDKNLFGQDVTDHFPSATVDIEEAGKCLALSRATACVFHLMRVMEIGLRVLSATLNDPSLDPQRNPNWGAILGRCRAELAKPLAKRSPEWVADEHFLSEAAATLEAVKNAWRNPTMHVEISYDDDKALDVWNSVRAFMRHLATKLKE